MCYQDIAIVQIQISSWDWFFCFASSFVAARTNCLHYITSLGLYHSLDDAIRWNTAAYLNALFKLYFTISAHVCNWQNCPCFFFSDPHYVPEICITAELIHLPFLPLEFPDFPDGKFDKAMYSFFNVYIFCVQIIFPFWDWVKLLRSDCWYLENLKFQKGRMKISKCSKASPSDIIKGVFFIVQLYCIFIPRHKNLYTHYLLCCDTSTGCQYKFLDDACIFKYSC